MADRRARTGRRPTPATRPALAAWLADELGAELLVVAGARRRRAGGAGRAAGARGHRRSSGRRTRMTAASPPLVNFGWRAADFRLADTKGKVWTPRQLRGPKGLRRRCSSATTAPTCWRWSTSWSGEGKALHDLGFGVAAICSNDAAAIPRTATRRWAPSPASTTSPSPTCTTSTRRSPAPTARPARRTSSASTPS